MSILPPALHPHRRLPKRLVGHRHRLQVAAHLVADWATIAAVGVALPLAVMGLLGVAISETQTLGAEPVQVGEGLSLRIESGGLARTLLIGRDGQLRTMALALTAEDSANRDSANKPAALAVAPASDEFALVGLDGRTVTAHDYRVVGHQLGTDGPARTLVVTLAPRQAGLPQVLIEYRGSPGERVIRKRLRVSHPAGAAGWVVDRAEVERLALATVPALTVGGGFGQPVFVTVVGAPGPLALEVFAGLEFPAGATTCQRGVLVSGHHPGRADFVSPWAIIGLASGGRAGDEFERYHNGVRRPPRPLLIYNPWYDLRGSQLRPETLTATIAAFDAHLMGPYGLTFDAVVIDDGWQNRRSCWSPGPSWPGGLTPLADTLARRGHGLGLWLPLSGYHLDTAWGHRNHGWELTDAAKGYCCLSGPTWNAAVRAVASQHIADSRLRLIKHDFNYLDCAADGHGHVPTLRHGREANTVALLDLLAAQRAAQPDIALVLTTGTWPSPWWLTHADAVWMGGHDYGRDPHRPRRGARDAEMTFRDAELYQLLRGGRAVGFPASALMTHGLIRGRYEGIDPTETDADWADYAALFFGRGTQLHELYISPDLMPHQRWSTLGAMIAWARAEAPTLAHTRMIGGRPDHGQAYGYIHWAAHRGLACLRNPGSTPCHFPLTTDQRPAYLPDQPQWHALQIYPHRQRLGPLAHGTPLTITLAAHSVGLIELRPDWPPDWGKTAVGGMFDIQNQNGRPVWVDFPTDRVEVYPCGAPHIGYKEWHGTWTVWASDRHTTELEVTRRPAHGTRLAVVVDGVPLSPDRTLTGPGWDRAVYAWPAAEAGSRTLTLDTSLPLSPLWPQRAEVSAVLRVIGPARPKAVIALVDATEQPIWPPIAQPPQLCAEWTLIDAHTMTRHRGPIESLAWLMVLGAVPLMVPSALVYRAVAKRDPRWGWPAVAAVVLVLLVVVTQTSWGAVLARCLTDGHQATLIW